MNVQTVDLKTVIKKWLISIDKTDKLPLEIVSLCFNVYEGPYAVELIGSAWFDAEDEDWACDEAFEPTQRLCPDFVISETVGWEDALEKLVEILKDLINELNDLKLFQVEHIAVGFVGGDLIVLK